MVIMLQDIEVSNLFTLAWISGTTQNSKTKAQNNPFTLPVAISTFCFGVAANQDCKAAGCAFSCERQSETDFVVYYADANAAYANDFTCLVTGYQ